MPNPRTTALAQGKKSRAEFLAAFAKHRDLDDALDEIGKNRGWLYQNTGRWADFRAAYQAMKRRETTPGENAPTEHAVPWDKTFAGFRESFIGRESPWFHIDLCDKIRQLEGGDVLLVIWPPRHGKTSLFIDLCTHDLCIDPRFRITVGAGTKPRAEKIVSLVKNRLEADVSEYWKLRERFGPFAPMQGVNAHGQPQVWGAGGFNLFKRRLGDELDFNMQALGMGSRVAGTRAERLMIDDPQEVGTLSQTDKILAVLRDDWFMRPGLDGSTVILMNVVGDDDIADRLYEDPVITERSVLKAYDPQRYEELGPRPNKDGNMEVSPWLWPEAINEAGYARLKEMAGAEGWARKYQQDWRPAVGRTFTKQMWENCQNPLRSVTHPPPKHPADKPAEIACSLDPGFKRAAVTACALEPTILRFLDSFGASNLKTWEQQTELLIGQVRQWHRPGISHVKWVVVETKGQQRGFVTDDALLELQAEIGFEIVSQDTGWDKRDEDFGVAQMGLSMSRGELDFPAGDQRSVDRFASLMREMLDWRPLVHGNKQKMDELMSGWFIYKLWHKQRRRSIRRGSNAAQFGFGGVPTMPGFLTPAPIRAPDLTGWRFGQQPVGR